ncbi:MAG TPA: sulfotransferase domain-containing protein [Phycisphaerales bacterium]|nr:sulfotransferase domain-containing protein [Phycisphaerales bacterium]
MRGHPRSGTNWVGRLINLHPQAFVTGEFHLEAIYHASEASKTYPWQLMHDEPVRSELTAAVQDVIRRCIGVGCEAQRPRPPVEQGKRPPPLPALRWHGDRTPRDLMDWMPGERYIWILRDGRDVMVSWTFHQLRMGEAVIGKSIPSPVKEHLLELSAALHADPEFFRKHPERLLSSEEWVRRTAHTWNHRFQTDSENAAAMQTDATPSRVLCMRYEALREHTERERQRLYEFLELDPALAQPVSREQYTAPGFEAENTLSFTRKGEVGDWRNYFTDDAKRWFQEVAGESLVRAGYARDADWSEAEREIPVVTAAPAVAPIRAAYSEHTKEHTHTR